MDLLLLAENGMGQTQHLENVMKERIGRMEVKELPPISIWDRIGIFVWANWNWLQMALDLAF